MTTHDSTSRLQLLSIAIFSGLSLATLLTLFVIPCFYVLLHDLFAGKAFNRLRRRYKRSGSAEAATRSPQ